MGGQLSTIFITAASLNMLGGNAPAEFPYQNRGSDAFRELLDEHCVFTGILQQQLQELPTGRWDINFQGTPNFRFGNVRGDIEFQVLGSSTPFEFLWATPNHPSAKAGVISAPLLELVQQLKSHERTRDIPEIRADKITCDIEESVAIAMIQNEKKLPLDYFGHAVCQIACGIYGGAAYYSCPTQRGCRLWVVLKEREGFPRFKAKYPKGSAALLNKIRQFFTSMLMDPVLCPINHQRALASCLEQCELRYEIVPHTPKKSSEDVTGWVKFCCYVSDNQESIMRFVFDDMGRMRSCDADLSAACYPD